jgi:hypothetical protein
VFKQFPDWSRLIGLEVKSEDVDTFGAALDAVAAAAEVDFALGLVKIAGDLAIDRTDVESAFVEQIRSAGYSLFPSEDNQAALHLASTAVLAEILYGVADARQLAIALSIASMSPFRRAKQPLLESAYNLAHEVLSARSARLRDVAARDGRGWGIDFDATIPAATPPPAAGARVDEVFQALSSVVAQLNRVLESAWVEARLRTEETDLLWWMSTGHSMLLDKQIGSYPIGSATLLTGIEAASRVREIPGPASLNAIATRMLEVQRIDIKKTISIRTVFENAIDEVVDLMASRSEKNTLPFCPISLAAIRFKEASGNAAWSEIFASATGYDPTKALPVPAFVNQVAREKLLSAVIQA